MDCQEKIEEVTMIKGIRLNDSNREKRNYERRLLFMYQFVIRRFRSQY